MVTSHASTLTLTDKTEGSTSSKVPPNNGQIWQVSDIFGVHKLLIKWRWPLIAFFHPVSVILNDPCLPKSMAA